MRVAIARPARRPNLALLVTAASGLVVFLVVSALAAGLFMVSPGNGSASEILASQPGAIPWNARTTLTALIIATDDNGNAASFDVASLDPTAPRLGLLALPANLWVSAPGSGQETLAQAYRDGGVPLVRETAEGAIGAYIPYYAVITPAAGRAIAAQLRGLSPGTAAARRLSASAALRRLAPTNLETQNRVAVAALSHARRTFPVSILPTFLNSVGTHLHTNVPYDRLPLIVQRLESLAPSAIHTGRADVSPVSARFHSYVLPDPNRLRYLANRTLHPYRITAPVRILNASGLLGQAGALATWLGQMRVPVTSYATAGSSDLGRTQVVVSPSAPPALHAAAQNLAHLLNIPITLNRSDHQITILIGHDFQSPVQH